MNLLLVNISIGEGDNHFGSQILETRLFPSFPNESIHIGGSYFLKEAVTQKKSEVGNLTKNDS